jgi:ribosomal protein S21
MKKIILSILLTCASVTLIAAEKDCESALSKLKPACNVGKVFNEMKEFSKKNKTVNQSLENTGVIKKVKPGEKRNTLKKLAEDNKTIDQTIRNMKKESK